jgi:NAD(P)-dependent dehydrogenase (short-subunit alcohol dehydrogenase family)
MDLAPAFHLAGKNVLITGAARGIGAATARKLAARGARLALVGLEPEALAALATELGGAETERAVSGREHIWAEADVTDSSALQAAVAKVMAVFGGLDVVVANAGIASFGTVRCMDPETFAKTVDVNLTGVFRTVQAALPHLVDSRGYVLVVSSAAALVPMAGASAYGASKAGVEAFADALRIEVAPLGVAVGCAHMSWVDTDMVRDAERDLPTFREMRQRLPWPLRSTTSVTDCAAAFERAIERRSRRVNIPAAIGVCHWIRPLVHSRPVDAVIARMSTAAITRLKAQIGALGRSVNQLRHRGPQ